jgi:hypothetical protein
MTGQANAASSLLCGFNNTRGGETSLANSAVAGLRAAIVAQFPGVKVRLFAQLSKASLTGCRATYIAVITSPTSGIKPLSAAEQTALKNYVDAGGVATLFTDNNTFVANATTINNSVLKPFGLAATGTLTGGQPITLKSGNNPVASGPAGNTSQLDTFYPGWFAKLGTSTELGSFPANGKPGLAWLPAGALGHGSGAVVMFADASLVLDGTRSAEDTTGILNALALGLR